MKISLSIFYSSQPLLNKYTSSNICLFEKLHLFNFAIRFQQRPYVTLGIVFFFQCLSIALGALKKTLFDCQGLVSTCCIYACWLLVISINQISMYQSSVSNMELTQHNLILPTTVVGTFPLFITRFDGVQLASTIFLLALAFRVSNHPDGQVLCIWQPFYLLLHFLYFLCVHGLYTVGYIYYDFGVLLRCHISGLISSDFSFL